MGKPPARLGRTNAETGVVIMPVVAGEIGEESAPGGEHPRERSSVEAPRMQLRDESADVRRLQVLQPKPARLLKERVEVAPIAAHGVGAQPPLVREVLEIAL